MFDIPPLKKLAKSFVRLWQLYRSKWGTLNLFVTFFNAWKDECCALYLICLIVAISFVWCLHEHSINMKLIDPVLLYCNPFARLYLQLSGAMFLSISLILNNHTALYLHIMCTIIRWLQWVCTFPGVLDWDYLITRIIERLL